MTRSDLSYQAERFAFLFSSLSPGMAETESAGLGEGDGPPDWPPQAAPPAASASRSATTLSARVSSKGVYQAARRRRRWHVHASTRTTGVRAAGPPNVQATVSPSAEAADDIGRRGWSRRRSAV